MEQETHSIVHDFDLIGGAICLDFVNTGSARREGPFKDRLRAYDDLVSWAESAGAIAPDEVAGLRQLAASTPDRAVTVLERGRTLREAVYRLFSALARGEQPPASDLELLSREQARASAHRQLTMVDGRVEFGWQPSPELDRPLWAVAQSASDLLTASECL